MAADLESICQEEARKIPGAAAVPGGGIKFARRGFEAEVEFRGGDTFVDIDTKSSVSESLQVGTAGLWHDLKNLLGIRDFQMGDSEFDEDYNVVTSRAEFAHEILTPDLRSVLRTFRAFYGFVLRISPAGFQLRVRALPKTAQDLDRMMVTAFQFFDALLGSGTEEGVTMTAVDLGVKEDTNCKVCGTALSRGAVVRCAKCSAPHHADCWEFNGKCSMFACGSTESW